MNRVLAYGNVVFQSMKYALQRNLIDGFILFTILVQPLLVAMLALWMLKDKGADYAIFVVVGSGMSGLWSSLLFISGNAISEERWIGTLESLTGMPTPLGIIVFGKNMANVLQSLLSIIGTYLLASLIFGYPLKIAMPLQFIVSVFVLLLAFVPFGLIIAAMFILTPAFRSWQNGLEFPVFILSGFLFPILMLPSWCRPISYALPTYWAAQALHISARGSAPVEKVYFSWGIMVLSALILLVVAVFLFQKIVIKAKKDATLDAQ